MTRKALLHKARRFNSHICFLRLARIVSSHPQHTILKSPVLGRFNTRAVFRGSAVRTEWNGRSVFAVCESRANRRA